MALQHIFHGAGGEAWDREKFLNFLKGAGLGRRPTQRGSSNVAGWEVFHENGGFNGKIHENHLDQWVVVVPYVWLPEVSPFKMKNFDEENMEKWGTNP